MPHLSLVFASYPILTDALEAMFPKKGDVYVARCPGKVELVVVDLMPVFFCDSKSNGGQHVPTLRMLHQFPQMLPKMVVDEGAAEHIMSGTFCACGACVLCVLRARACTCMRSPGALCQHSSFTTLDGLLLTRERWTVHPSRVQRLLPRLHVASGRHPRGLGEGHRRGRVSSCRSLSLSLSVSPSLSHAPHSLTHPCVWFCARYVQGKEHAVAIGRTNMSGADMRSINKGTAVTTLHYLADGLWPVVRLE
jgi:predicted ribosome-associated RNA-binding protein Tma20